uniref:Uncharacterized protein n=1 Tax=Ananas comosus var. bracteatus TaxID=296719 RepID=A0A6V7PFX7_ANACO|nr:unnamed protein product [Ananas comosus var. bracteatus]
MFCSRQILRFREVVTELGLIDLPIRNCEFTWSNGRRNPFLERLDRAFISQGWQSVFPRSTLRALPRPRFESYWLRYPSLNEVVSNFWNLTVSGLETRTGFYSKIKKVTEAIKSWSAGLSSSVKKQANVCLAWIEWLDKAAECRSLTDLELAIRPKLKEIYDELCLQEELEWRQRSRVQWLKKGDANTKFVHANATYHNSLNRISRLSDGTPIFSSPESIDSHLYNFFRNQLGVEQACRHIISLPLIYDSANSVQLNLESPFSEEEVKRAVFASAPDKAPGPDGFPTMFFQRYWSLIKADVMKVFDDFYNGMGNLDGINDSWICLIPKKPGAALASDYRPISLVNSLAKFISKVLASRLQRQLGLLINPYQAAFIHGRHILDNFFVPHILTHHLHSI